MKRKGFTLIELLAVIVILAIIAVIATPIITGIIEDSKKASFERSVEGIVKGTELDVAFKLGDSGYTYEITNGEIPKLDSNVSISNTKGYSGIIKYDSEAKVSYAIYNDTWCVIKTDSESIVKNYIEGECSLPSGEVTRLMYNDGDVVYYDVLQGKTCTASEYHIDNSLTGYNGTSSTKTTDNQNSCLKFYAFNDDEGDSTVDLLLDHNTTATIVWTTATEASEVSYNENINGTTLKNVISKATLMPVAGGAEVTNFAGPKEVIEQLKIDTDSWVGTVIPENYTVSQTDAGNYTIDYSTYKARLITANEVAEITGNTSFNESTTVTSGWLYFDTNTTTQSSTCKSGNTTGCSYGWLYDRTSTSCTTYGCLNNSDAETYGYWTSTSASGSSRSAWYVHGDGRLVSSDTYGDDYGVRPVITLYKSNF